MTTSLSINTNTDISFVEFETCSGRVSDLRTKVVKQKGVKTYLVHPLTTQSLNFHRNLYPESSLENADLQLNSAGINNTIARDQLCRTNEKVIDAKHVGDPKTDVSILTKFWEEHYFYRTDTQSRIEPENVFLFFKNRVHSNIQLDQFKSLSGKVGVSLAGQAGHKKYKVAPRSRLAQEWHELVGSKSTNHIKPIVNASGTAQCSMSLINIRGLITDHKNKSKMLELKCDKGGNNLIAVTESWLYKDVHFDEEVLSAFPNYSIKRADRKVQQGRKKKRRRMATGSEERKEGEEEEDENKDLLESGGGCLLLASPGLTLLPIESLCNGICELLICEIPQINTARVVVHNSPKPDFDFIKVK